MLIDWFTVGAQTLNFLVLVWLLKRYLYQPILNAIDAREQRIAMELAEAQAKKAEAQQERDEFQHKNEAFDRQRAAYLSQAIEEAKAERQRLLDEARQAANTLGAQWQETLRNDAQAQNQAISLLAQREVFAIARKALADLATVGLEEQMAEVFTQRLQAMDAPAKAVFAKAFKTASEPALVRSAFELPAGQRMAIQKTLNETLLADPSTSLRTGPSTSLRTGFDIRFETVPELVAGIELSVNGQKLAWSITDYLASLEKGVFELLKQQDEAAAKPEAKPEPNSQ
jgi:F-type H+-transporting ATPase subunit b